MPQNNPIITVFTPSYNRGYTLHLCYDSLRRQTCKDFIWMIIDDGSTDNTQALVHGWQQNDNGFTILYIYKENGGMHTAHNTAYEMINTELNTCIDSDDYMTDNAIELILDCWQHRDKTRKDLAGIVAYDITADHELIGQPFDLKLKHTTLTALNANGCKGDKKLIYRTDVINQYPPYPVFTGEKYVSLAYKYSLIDLAYQLIVLPQAVCVVEYRTDGSSLNMFQQYLKNPQGFAFIRIESMKISKSFKNTFRNAVHYVSSSILLKNKHFLRESPKKLYTIAAVPFGILLTLHIKKKSKHFLEVEGIQQ